MIRMVESELELTRLSWEYEVVPALVLVVGEDLGRVVDFVLK
jgi:hypothetical protein